MATFWMTFRIHDETVNGASYEDRYYALTQAAKAMGTHWDVPTSYIVFSGYADLDAVLATLTQHLSARHDVLMVGQVGVQDVRIWGANPDGDIFKLITYLKKA